MRAKWSSTLWWDTVGERERVAQADVEKLGAGVEHRVGEGVLVLDTERACGIVG